MPAGLWRLGVLVPATVAGTLGTDVALRALSHDRFSFRAWEAMRTPGEDSPFLPSHRYHNDRTYGNLAAIANLPAYRQYRSVTFTTDASGYPNPPGGASRGPVAAITVGSSFTAGSELGDGATLAAQLGLLSGRSVYNAGGATPDFAGIRAATRRLAARGGGTLVVIEHPGAREVPPLTTLHVPHKTARCRELVASLGLDSLCPLAGWLDRHTRVSPLEILAQRLLKRVEDDRWMPNPYGGLAFVAPLENGDEMLFLTAERDWSRQPRSEHETVRYFRWLAAQLERERITPLVVLLPEKYLVYAPLLRERDPAAEREVAYLNRVQQGLRAAGVPVVNLTTPLREAAATALVRGSHVYFLDDTHWNAAGAAVGVEQIRRAWDELTPTP